MAIHIEMPKLSDTMTEGTVVRWLKKVGDQVEIGDEIAEIETDKATMAMEAFDEGLLSEILIEEGGKADVGATLAVLLEEGEEPPAESTPAVDEPKKKAKAAAPKKTAEREPAPAPEPVPVLKIPEVPEAIEASFAPALEADPDEEPVPEPISFPPAEPAAPAASTSAPVGSSLGERVKASPLARKIAEANGVDLSKLSGTGPGGRIVKKDVEAAMGATPVATKPPVAAAVPTPAPAKPAAEEPAPAPAPPARSEPAAAPAPKPAPAPAPQPVVPVASGEDQRIELSNLRRIIAERLLTSKTTIPHFYLHMEADAAALMDIRKQINVQAEASHGNKYTVNDFVLKAVINSLQALPAVNASFHGDHIVQFAQIGVAVAVAVDDGLVTPVIKDAAAKSLLQISREVKDLAARAREGKLLPNEFDGGTVTVSNLGAYGVRSFDAIINPPQAAILSVGVIEEKPVVVDGEIVPGLRMDLGLSCDHRVVDGAVGAQFLASVKKFIEKPALMLV